MEKQPTPNNKFIEIGVVAAILVTILLGFAPSILKAAAPKADLAGPTHCDQAASCTPTPCTNHCCE